MIEMTDEEFKEKVRAAIEAELARPLTEDWTCGCGAITIKAPPRES